MKEELGHAATLMCINVFWYCRYPDDGTPMVQCDGKHCGEWFHISCIDSKKASDFVKCVHEQ